MKAMNRALFYLSFLNSHFLFPSYLCRMTIHDETIEKVRALDSATRYEACRFRNCDLSYANLTSISFIDCVFEQCNLSLAITADTALQDVVFKDCKLTGLDFSKCRSLAFGVSFMHCNMESTSFHKCKLKGTDFVSCILKGTDFAACDLTNANFDNCDLDSAIFDQTNLKGADFRTAYNFVINPEQNSLKQAKFSIYGLPGLLAQCGIIIE